MNFRKQISLFLAFFLLLSQTGWAINVHFCSSKIAAVTLSAKSNSNKSEKNCCGSTEKKSKCCQNKVIKATEKSEIVFSKLITFSPEFAFLNSDWNPIFLRINAVNHALNSLEYYCNSNAPPIFKLNCQFVFYA